MVSAPPFRIILIGTEYEINLGSAARLLRNFGLAPLYLVNPACDPKGFTSRMHAKHAAEMLEKAVICETLEKALSGCSQVVGTTGVLRRHVHAIRHPLTLEQFRSRLGAQKPKKRDGPIALLFGPEGIGLSEAHLNRCDVLITIPTKKKYPVMNLSHALAVVLYALCAQEKKVSDVHKPADLREAAQVVRALTSLTERYAYQMNNPSKVKLAMRRVLSRALPNKTETHAFLSTLMPALRELDERPHRPKFEKKD